MYSSGTKDGGLSKRVEEMRRCDKCGGLLLYENGSYDKIPEINIDNILTGIKKELKIEIESRDRKSVLYIKGLYAALDIIRSYE